MCLLCLDLSALDSNFRLYFCLFCMYLLHSHRTLTQISTKDNVPSIKITFKKNRCIHYLNVSYLHYLAQL